MDPDTARDIRRYIGQRIAHAREVMGDSQDDLADRLARYTGQHWSRVMVAKMETAGKRIPVDVLCAVAAVQDRPVAWYFADAPDTLASYIPGHLKVAALSGVNAVVRRFPPRCRTSRTAATRPLIAVRNHSSHTRHTTTARVRTDA